MCSRHGRNLKSAKNAPFGGEHGRMKCLLDILIIEILSVSILGINLLLRVLTQCVWILLVDNADTMKDHWYEATYLLETLVMKAAGQDVNGADLLFTSGSVILNNEKDASKFRRAMKNPEALPRDNIHTHLRKPLGKIFANYLRGLEEGRKNAKSKVVKNLTLIILTDGIWAAIQNKDDVKRKIVSLVEAIREVTDNLQERPISIDFVQFGNDEGATYRLQCLDNDLKWEGIPYVMLGGSKL